MVIEKSNNQRLYGLTQTQRDLLKDKLTFDNPAYKQAKRYGRCKYTNIPPYLTYYEEYSERGVDERVKVFSVPIGVDVESLLGCEAENVINLRLSHSTRTSYPNFLLELRNDQIRAKEDYLKQIENPYPKCVVQLPTGKGKSILALNLACTLKQRTLILVHKDDLVTGWKKDIELCFGDEIDVGIIKAKKRKIGQHITIATVQTLSRMSKAELEDLTTQFGFVVQDEVHHVGLNIFNVINSFKSQYKLGLSATPTRSDGLNYVFDLYFGGIGSKYVYDENDKDICKVKVIIKKHPFKYIPFLHEKMVYNSCDYDPSELPDDITYLIHIPFKERPTVPFLKLDSDMVTNRRFKIQVCKDLISEYRQGRNCLMMFTQKEHINLYFNYLKRYIPKETIMLYYGDNKESSETLMQRAESGEARVTLATFAKATEGTNVKAWEVLFLVSSLNNEKNVEQATGRIRRSSEGKINPVLVYDYSCEGSYSIGKHIETRKLVYNRLNYIIEDLSKPKEEKTKKGLFSRGYR